MSNRAIDYGLDPNICYITGYLHDIGYIESKQNHGLIGAGLLNNLNVSPELTFAIQNHGKRLYDLEEVTPLLVLLVEADLRVNYKGKVVSFEERMKSISARYSTNTIDLCKDNIKYIQEFLERSNINGCDK